MATGGGKPLSLQPCKPDRASSCVRADVHSLSAQQLRPDWTIVGIDIYVDF